MHIGRLAKLFHIEFRTTYLSGESMLNPGRRIDASSTGLHAGAALEVPLCYNSLQALVDKLVLALPVEAEQ